ncbi:MAG: hypothetical protein R3D33_07165 [Hyphomicrobiaceae bacterium]
MPVPGPPRKWWLESKPSPGASEALPLLVVFLIGHAAIGALIGIIVAGLILLTDLAGIKSLILMSGDPVTPLVLLAAGFAVLFGGVYSAAAVMLLPWD